MTKDELQKEAYEWTEKNISVGISMYNPSIEMYCGKAYKDGAEPREKRIAELEAENEQIKNSDTLCKLIGEQKRKIAELEKQHDIVRNERNLFQERCEDILENYYCDHKCKCAELEAEVKEWKDKADLWCKTANLKDHNIMINKELEKENAELKKQVEKHKWNDIFLEDCAVYDNKIAEEYTTLQERIVDLEKENKELKRDKQNLRADLRTARNNLQAKDTAYHLTMEELNCVITDFNTFKSEAKELLKKLLVHSKRYIWIADDNNKPIMQKEIAEAEQFLSEVENEH